MEGRIDLAEGETNEDEDGVSGGTVSKEMPETAVQFSAGKNGNGYMGLNDWEGIG